MWLTTKEAFAIRTTLRNIKLGYIYIYIYIHTHTIDRYAYKHTQYMHTSAQLAGLQYTPTSSLQRGKTPPHIQCPRYDTKASDGEASSLLLWGMWFTIYICHCSQVHCPGVVTPEKVLSKGQFEQFDHFNRNLTIDLC